MAASNSNDPPAPEPRLARPFVARPASLGGSGGGAPASPAPIQAAEGSTPKRPRPFVPRAPQPQGSAARPSAERIGVAAATEEHQEHTATAAGARASEAGTVPADPAPSVDAVAPSPVAELTPATDVPAADGELLLPPDLLGVADRSARGSDANGQQYANSVWTGARLTEGDERALIDVPPPAEPLIDPESEIDVDAVVPGSDAARRLNLEPVADEVASAHGIWPPSADVGAASVAARRPTTAESESSPPERPIPPVVPPAEAWPDDVWPDSGEHRASTARDVAHVVPTVTAAEFENGMLGHADHGRASGDRTTPHDLTLVYEPAQPESVDAHALDATLNQVAVASAIYQAADAGDWAASAPVSDDVTSDLGAAGAPAAVTIGLAERPERGDNPGQVLGDVLRMLADDVSAGRVAVPSYTAGMSVSEALVAVLGALLKAGR